MESNCTYRSVRCWPSWWSPTVPTVQWCDLKHDRYYEVWLYLPISEVLAVMMESNCTRQSDQWRDPGHDRYNGVWLYQPISKVTLNMAVIMVSDCLYWSMRWSQTWPVGRRLTVPADRCVGVWLYLPISEVILDMPVIMESDCTCWPLCRGLTVPTYQWGNTGHHDQTEDDPTRIHGRRLHGGKDAPETEELSLKLSSLLRRKFRKLIRLVAWSETIFVHVSEGYITKTSTGEQ